jgi:molybdopterin/thiamine biosynthesis adenylyltransferase
MNGPLSNDPSFFDASLAKEINALSTPTQIPDIQDTVMTINDHQVMTLHRKSGLSFSDIYQRALHQGVLPVRYLRNHQTLSIPEQLRLAQSSVVVVGAGGLGGQVLLCLARIGVGRLIVIDPGRFEESNLNRQALCSMSTVGRTKTLTAKNILEEINPGTEVEIHPVRLTSENQSRLLASADVIVDALDSIKDRLVLETGSKQVGVPLVHAAIDGFFGQLMTIFPQDPGLSTIYGTNPSQPASGLGNLPMTAMSVATLQAMEVLKILLNRGQLFRHKMMTVELEQGLVEQFSF